MRFQFCALCALALLLATGCFENSNDRRTSAENTAVEPATTPEPFNQLPATSPATDLMEGLNAPSEVESVRSDPFPVRFIDSHTSAGVEFVFQNGAAAAKKLMPEATAGGAGWLDYDADGLPDLYFAQGGECWQRSWEGQPVDELYRNRGLGTFAAVTNSARLTDEAFGHSVAVGDYNEDGFDDIYVGNVGEDALHMNLGDGTFELVTAQAGISNNLWAASAAWSDLDGDNDLDLYVANYVAYNPLDPILCIDANGNPGTCHPRDVDPVPNCCFINQGDGTFAEEADQRGLNGPGSKSLGVVIADFSGDLRPDIYVANDTTANHMFINQGAGQFSEQGVALGCGASGLGHYQASMGVALGDYDRDGRLDLYVTHFAEDSNTLYRNLGSSGFTDSTREAALHAPTLPLLGFGTVMADFNADGWQDLFIANGHIDDWRELTGDDWYMQPQLFCYHGTRWDDCGASAGPYFERTFLGRGVAAADYDQDGDLDLLVVNQNDAAALLENRSTGGSWLQIRLVGDQSNRRGVGARVTVTQGPLQQVAQLAGGVSYCSAQQPVLSFGFGAATNNCELQIEWPSGALQKLVDVKVNTFLTVLEREASR